MAKGLILSLTKQDLRLVRALENGNTEWEEMKFKNRERLYQLPYSLEGLVTQEQLEFHETERALRGQDGRTEKIRAFIRRRLP